MTSALPRFRTHVRKRGEKVTTYFVYDRRPEGLPDVALGTDRDAALERWARLRAGEVVEPWFVRQGKAPRLKTEKRLANRTPGRRRAFEPGTWADVPPWAKRMYLNAERRSAEAGRVVFVNVTDFKAVVRAAGEHCQLTGLPFVFTKGRSPYAPSIDRIDSRQGYVAGNIRIVCLMVNQALGEWGEGPLQDLANGYLRHTCSASVPLA